MFSDQRRLFQPVWPPFLIGAPPIGAQRENGVFPFYDTRAPKQPSTSSRVVAGPEDMSVTVLECTVLLT